MLIAVAQIDPVVGAFEANVKKIKEAYERACAEHARLLLTPEMGICGYPLNDLVERPEIAERCEAALDELAKLTVGKSCALAVGHVAKNPDSIGRAAQDVATVLENGKRVHRQVKSLLPTYDVFDEARYFEPGNVFEPWICDGHKIAVAVCEDLWAEDPSFGRQLYHHKPVDAFAAAGAELVVSLSASPYFQGKYASREKLHCDVAKQLGIPLIYANQVGANDEVLFDGGSFAADAKGGFAGRLPFFEKSFGLIDVDFEAKSIRWVSPKNEPAIDDLEVLARGLVVGIRDYFERTGFKTAILGVSGGIDSAVVAALAARALGPKNVLGVAMPSQYSSSHSLADAEALARSLGISYEVRPIKFPFSTLSRDLAEHRGQLAPIALENLQSRLRGLIVMTLSNHYGALALTTGNKSEIAVGYCTMYGDMVGALAPIGDLFKTRVYELARYLNRAWGNPIPESSISKPPSAELRPGQLDQDSLPPYEVLDPLLEAFLERSASVEELIQRFGKAIPGRGPEWVTQTVKLVENNEYKRRQSAVILKTSPKAFGIGRRIPLAKKGIQS